MRITTSKNIPFRKLSKDCYSEQQSISTNKKEHSIKTIKTIRRNPHHSKQQNHATNSSQQYGLTLPKILPQISQSILTQPKTQRSRSNSKNGISMSRLKGIRIQRIYQQKHFQTKLLQSKSNKSIQTNTIDISRISRITIPLTKFDREDNKSQHPTVYNKDTKGDVFDFKQLKHQINSKQHCRIHQNIHHTTHKSQQQHMINTKQQHMINTKQKQMMNMKQQHMINNKQQHMINSKQQYISKVNKTSLQYSKDYGLNEIVTKSNSLSINSIQFSIQNDKN